MRKYKWGFSETNEGDDRLKNRKRDRHTLESDRKSGRKENYLNKLGVDVKGVAKDSEKL